MLPQTSNQHTQYSVMSSQSQNELQEWPSQDGQLSVVLNYCPGARHQQIPFGGLCASAAARVAYASSVYIANACAALSQIEGLLRIEYQQKCRLCKHSDTAKVELLNVLFECSVVCEVPLGSSGFAQREPTCSLCEKSCSNMLV